MIYYKFYINSASLFYLKCKVSCAQMSFFLKKNPGENNRPPCHLGALYIPPAHRCDSNLKTTINCASGKKDWEMLV
jgi:hypothetical protein